MQVRREHSRAEVARKLSAKGYSGDVIEELLERVLAEGIVDEHRYAEAYVRSRSAKGYGPQRIKAELRERGISSELAYEYLNDAQYDWFEMALMAYQKKYGGLKCQDYKEIAKRRRFLMQRGFDSEQQKYAMSEND